MPRANEVIIFAAGLNAHHCFQVRRYERCIVFPITAICNFAFCLDVLNSFNEGQENNYTRLQVTLEKEDKKLDDVREQTTENLTRKAQEIIGSSQYQKIVKRLKKQLCKEGVYQKENMQDKMCPIKGE